MEFYSVKHKKTGSLCLHIASSRKEAIDKWLDMFPATNSRKAQWEGWRKSGYTTVKVVLLEKSYLTTVSRGGKTSILLGRVPEPPYAKDSP